MTLFALTTTPRVIDTHDYLVTGNRPRVDLEVIVPAFNEERRLTATIQALTAELDHIVGFSTQVVVVDNGSSDRTAEIVDHYADGLEAGASETTVHLIGCSEAGKGAAVRRGVMTSSARYVGYFDADLATPTETLPRALGLLLNGDDVVIGSRRCVGGEFVVPEPWVRRAAGWLFRQAIHGLVPGVRDTQCGFKLFSQQAAARLFDGLTTTGFTFDVELLMRANDCDYPVREVPIGWSHDSKSSLHLFADAPRILAELVRLRRLRPPASSRRDQNASSRRDQNASSRRDQNASSRRDQNQEMSR